MKLALTNAHKEILSLKMGNVKYAVAIVELVNTRLIIALAAVHL
jgi:hypothetical protein